MVTTSDTTMIQPVPGNNCHHNNDSYHLETDHQNDNDAGESDELGGMISVEPPEMLEENKNLLMNVKVE